MLSFIPAGLGLQGSFILLYSGLVKVQEFSLPLVTNFQKCVELLPKMATRWRLLFPRKLVVVAIAISSPVAVLYI